MGFLAPKFDYSYFKWIISWFMKLYFFAIISIILPINCSHDFRSEEKIKAKSLAVAENYITDRMINSKKTEYKNGLTGISNENRTYIINPSKIYTGFIDDDNDTDAIVTLDVFEGQYQIMSEHLILIQKNGRMVFNRAIESDMKIFEIKDRIITAEVPTHDRNSPLFDCSSCQEVVNYRFVNGDLVRME